MYLGVCWGNPRSDITGYMSSSCLTVPVCHIKFETSLLSARQAGYVSFTIVSSDWYLFFQWITEWLRINALLCFQQPNGVWQHIQAGFPGGHLWSEFRWISQGAWRIDHFIHTEAVWGRPSNLWTHWGSGKGFMSKHKRKIIAMQSLWICWPYGLCCICAARHVNRRDCAS